MGGNGVFVKNYYGDFVKILATPFSFSLAALFRQREERIYCLKIPNKLNVF
jgi:hypothetical protein